MGLAVPCSRKGSRMSDDESLEIARQFVANSPFPASLLDMHGCSREFSPHILEMLSAAGLSGDTLLGQPGGELVARGEMTIQDAFARLAGGEQIVELDRTLS